MKVFFLISFFLILNISTLFSQAPIGQWVSHIPNQKGLSLCEAESKIYCLTETGIFYYNKSDNSIQKIGKIEGLYGIRTRSINYHKPTKTVYIGYDDGTIDLIKNNNQIVTLTDISRKSYTTKNINKIQIIEDLIYFSTDFGIVIYDPYQHEFKDTYIIGDNGYEIRVNSITIDDNYLYAATEHGVRKALKSSKELPNYASWIRIINIPNSNNEFNAVAFFKNKLIASYQSETAYKNKTYIVNQIDNTYETLNPDTETYTQELKVINKQLFVIHKNHIGVYNNFNSPSEFYNKTSVSWGNVSINTYDIIIDNNKHLWYADQNYGLVKSNYNLQAGEYKVPNGPKNNNAYYLSTGNGNTWLAPGAIFETGVNSQTPASLSQLKNNYWKNYGSSQIPIFKQTVDIIAIEQVPNYPNKIFCCSGANGILEIDFTNTNKPEVILHNDTTGSTLTAQFGHRVQVVDAHLDDQLNLWSINPYTTNPFNVMKSNGDWKAMPYGNSAHNYGRFIIAEDGAKWVMIKQRKGLFVFNEYGTIDDETDDFSKRLDVKDKNGTIISNDLFAIAEDHNNQIWIGTHNGIVVYYNPKNVYNDNQEGFYGSKIIIDINGKNEYLMEGKKVTAIAVDGANRKWIGTDQSGIFLMSSDGTEQLLTFNTENSPLPSDKIKSISIDGETGEVFIATSLGLMSYRGTATNGNEYFNDVYAFPNPVKPEYDGPITIKGLMKNTIVKITDISGNLVTEMNSLGGQAIWNGKTLNGNRAKTGVYLVFLSDQSGEFTSVTKILFIN